MGQSLNYKVVNGEPELNIFLEKNDFFPGEIIKGILKLKSANLLKKGIINYQLLNQEYYSYKDKQNKIIEEKRLNSILLNSLIYPEIIDFSLIYGIDIPFEINLPNEIFPNFEYYISKAIGNIRNIIVIDIPELDLVKQKIIIIKNLFKLLKSPLSYNNFQYKNLLGIFYKGNILLKATYNKNCYKFFNKIPVEISITNNTNNNLEIYKINLQFLRKIIFKNSNCIDKTNEFNDILFNNEMSVDKILDKNNNTLILNVDINIEEPESLFNKYKFDPVNYNYYNINDKSNLIKLIPDINSNLFDCKYQIKIECIYKSMIKNEKIYLYMPVSVSHEDENKDNSKKIQYNNLKDNKNNTKTKKEKFSKIKEEEKINEENKENLKNKENKKNKEPNLYTNYGNDDWNTPTNDEIKYRTK